MLLISAVNVVKADTWECTDGLTSDGISYLPNALLASVKSIDDTTYFTYEETGETYPLLSGNISQNSMNLAHGGTSATANWDQYMAELDAYTEGMEWTVDFDGATLHGYSVCNAGSNAWTKPLGAVKTGALSGTYNGCSCSLDKQRWVIIGKPSNDSDFTGWVAKNTNCRQNCPYLCAQTIATNSTFRQTILNNSCEIPEENGGSNSGGGTVTVQCEDNQFIYNNSCIDSVFTIKTVPNTNYFKFTISAKGTFYVDWGDGNVTAHTNLQPGEMVIEHDYSVGRISNIRIGGVAEAYSSQGEMAAISFTDFNGATNTASAIAEISGSLSLLFPTIGDGDTFETQPRFYRTFNQCVNLSGNLPSTLFSSLSGAPVEYMFYSTFMGCGNITGPIPNNFFGGVNGQPASYMFDGTFSGCSKLGTKNGLPFYSIPANLFANIHGTTVAHMFPGTFFDCAGLTGTIPHDLFANISGEPKERIFAATFSGCSNLTGTIPSDLFQNIYGSLVDKAFRRTFLGTTSLEGWVPYELFANMNNDEHMGDGMLNIFQDSGITTACPENYYKANTEFDDFWDNRVSCLPCLNGKISSYGSVGESACHYQTYECYAGEYLDVSGGNISCQECPAGYYCPHGIWTPETADNSKTLCPNGTVSAPGTMDENGCVETPFEIDIKPYTDKVIFRISAKGNYVINWGDGKIENISISSATPTKITHNYESYMHGDTYTIGIASINVSEYYAGNDDYYGAITFGMVTNPANETNTYDKIIAMRGSLGAVFPTLNNGDSLSTQPRFAYTFNNCDKITTPIPQNIFEGVHGAPVDYMFFSTFGGCTGITGEITDELFADIIGETAEGMFSNTFYNCQNIVSEIPGNLFAGIYGTPKEAMYSNTFNGCKKLYGSIPPALFGNINGAPAVNMYSGTFDGCENLSGSIPDGLFGNIYGSVQDWMYYGTFYGCKNLSGYIPRTLFGRLSGNPAWMMFYQTFYKDTNLIGFIDYSDGQTYRFIPYDFFGNINKVNYDEENMSMYQMFTDTGLYTKCPVGYYKYDTGFNVDLEPKVSCIACPVGTTTMYEGAVSESECLYEVYNVIYDYTNGGSGCEDETVNTGEDKEILCEPENYGYEFTGWYNSVDGGSKITYISADNTEDIVLYAHWKPLCLDNETWNGSTCVCKNGYVEIDMPWINNYKLDADDYEPYQAVHPDTYEEMRDAMKWRAIFNNSTENREMAGIVLDGEAFCSADASRNVVNGTAASGSDVLDELTGTGQYCWCRMTNPAVSRWVYVADIASGGLEGCQRRCPGYCGSYISGVTVKQSVVRKAIYDNILTDTGKVCVSPTEEPQEPENNCEKHLYIGSNDKMCLYPEQNTHPALAVKIGNKIYYANMSEQNIPMNKTSNKKIHVLYGNTTYNLYDEIAE